METKETEKRKGRIKFHPLKFEEVMAGLVKVPAYKNVEKGEVKTKK